MGTPEKESIIRAWVSQILAVPGLSEAISAGGQVEVRLFAHRGQVRKSPIVVLNAGPSAMVDA